MAAKAGQILQAELLVVYGADPGAPDINGRTPMDYARYERCAGFQTPPRCSVSEEKNDKDDTFRTPLLILRSLLHDTVKGGNLNLFCNSGNTSLSHQFSMLLLVLIYSSQK